MITMIDKDTIKECLCAVAVSIFRTNDLPIAFVRKCKYTFIGRIKRKHVSRSSGLAKIILQGTVKGGRRQGRQRKRWEDNIREWTGLEFAKSQRAVVNREEWI